MKITLEYRNPSPSHCDVAVFVNGALAGVLTLRQEEVDVFQDVIAHGLFMPGDAFMSTGDPGPIASGRMFERDFGPQQEPPGPPVKDHEIAQAVNAIRDAAIAFRDAQQLRERVAGIVVPLLKRAAPPAELRERLEELENLLRALTNARPLLLYGEKWIERIKNTLGDQR